MRLQAFAALLTLWAALYHTAVGSVLRIGAHTLTHWHFDARPLTYYFPPLGAQEPAVRALAKSSAPGAELAWGRALSEALASLPDGEAKSVQAQLAARGLHANNEHQLQLAARVIVAEAGSEDAGALTFFCGDPLTRFARERALAENHDGSVEALFAALPPGACDEGSAALLTMTLLTAYRLRWPLPQNAIVTSPFGPRLHPLLGEEKFHAGTDLSVPDATRVLAAGSGVVMRAEVENGFGGYVSLAHGHGVSTYYAHLSHWQVYPKEQVKIGEGIATSGHSGAVTGPHLHFGVEIGGSPVDPLRVVAAPP